MPDRAHPLEGLLLTRPHVGNYGPEAGPTEACAVCEKPLTDPPPWTWPVPRDKHNVCSFDCALLLIESWILRPL